MNMISDHIIYRSTQSDIGSETGVSEKVKIHNYRQGGIKDEWVFGKFYIDIIGGNNAFLLLS